MLLIEIVIRIEGVIFQHSRLFASVYLIKTLKWSRMRSAIIMCYSLAMPYVVWQLNWNLRTIPV